MNGTVPRRCLSPFRCSATFDATTVVPESVSLEGAAIKLVGKGNKALCGQEDVNGDGFADLVCKVETEQLALEEGTTSAALTGFTTDGRSIRGEDSIRIVPDA